MKAMRLPAEGGQERHRSLLDQHTHARGPLAWPREDWRSRYIKCSHVQWHQTIGHERKMEQNVLRGAKAVSIRSMRHPPKANISKSACIANRNDRGRRDLALAKTLHATARTEHAR